MRIKLQPAQRDDTTLLATAEWKNNLVQVCARKIQRQAKCSGLWMFTEASAIGHEEELAAWAHSKRVSAQ